MKIEIQNAWVIVIAIVLIILLLAFGGYTLGSIKLPGGIEFVLSPPPTRIVEATTQFINGSQVTPEAKTDSSNPIEFYVSYWQNVSNGQYESAWQQLSPRFRQGKHNDDFSDYARGFTEKNYCRIEVSNTMVTQQDNDYVIVTANLSYFMGAQCNIVEYKIESRLIFDTTINSWLYDQTINITPR